MRGRCISAVLAGRCPFFFPSRGSVFPPKDFCQWESDGSIDNRKPGGDTVREFYP